MGERRLAREDGKARTVNGPQPAEDAEQRRLARPVPADDEQVVLRGERP